MDLQPSLPPKTLRWKAAGAIALIVALYGVDYVGHAFWPHYARFFPPFLLVLVAVGATVYALMVWRTDWMVSKLFPGQPAPAVRAHDRLIALVGVLLTIALLGLWIKSLFPE